MNMDEYCIFFRPLPFCVTEDNFVTASHTHQQQMYMSPCKPQTLYHSDINTQFFK